jgi:uncharacterized protein YaiI (UPF0178 family)
MSHETPPSEQPAGPPAPLLTVWVDADACPGPIKEILVRAALRRSVRTVFVANKFIALPQSPFLTTHDIPLAALLVAKGVTVIDPRGELYSEENVRERLSIRNFMHDLREEGVRTSGPAAFGQKSSQAFANTYDRELTRALRSAEQKPRE